MKKSYIKPSFAPVKLVSANGTCTLEVANWGYGSCPVETPGLGSIFGGPNQVDCVFDADDDELICFMTLEPNEEVFGS